MDYCILTKAIVYVMHAINRHKDSNRIRVLMRQEKTMKVIVNHFLDPRIVLVPNVGNDRSWVWVAFDFADGELVETVRLMTLLRLVCVQGPSSRHCWMYLLSP